ncbi:MAG: hypothetical protein DRJ01_07495 [Bacteroidetes bacterium]|nr:MAG: hypothetical protein DRJ01_07495 [Bacteroidota bacterium]
MKLLQKKIVLCFLVLISFSLFSNAQCDVFAKQKKWKEKLSPYTHNGVYVTQKINQGETIELYKTFFSNQDYRILICSDNNLPKIEFQILDINRNIIFDNKKNNFSNIWDFYFNTNLQTIVSIHVPKDKNNNKSGCIAVLIGFLDN